MLIIHNPEEWETVTTFTVCEHHKKYPKSNWPGCTCSSSITRRRRELDPKLKAEFAEWDALSNEVSLP